MAFDYRNGVLHADDAPLDEVARRFGTPCFVYSQASIESAYQEFARALASRNSLICYSVKANSNLAVLALLARLGAGFDIVSGGELALVIAAGGEPRKTLFSGVGKSEAEIRFAKHLDTHAAVAVAGETVRNGRFELAKDLVQEAFLKVFARWGNLREPHSFAAYLNRTIVNLAHKTHRRRRIERLYLDKHPRLEAVAPTRDYETADELWRQLQLLPQRSREWMRP